MITEDEAVDMLKRRGMDDSRIRHSQAVASFGYGLAVRIHDAHPELSVDPVKVKLAALLHDIGRTRPGEHERNSQDILRESGLPELADIVMHGSGYELRKARGVEDPSLLPRSLENRIVAYADARVRFGPISLEDRVEDAARRHGDNPEKAASIRAALPRLKSLEQELIALAKRDCASTAS